MRFLKLELGDQKVRFERLSQLEAMYSSLFKTLNCKDLSIMDMESNMEKSIGCNG